MPEHSQFLAETGLQQQGAAAPRVLHTRVMKSSSQWTNPLQWLFTPAFLEVGTSSRKTLSAGETRAAKNSAGCGCTSLREPLAAQGCASPPWGRRAPCRDQKIPGERKAWMKEKLALHCLPAEESYSTPHTAAFPPRKVSNCKENLTLTISKHPL